MRQIDDLPTPPGLPWLGQLFAVRPPTIHQQVEAWARAHGPLFRVRFGPRRVLVVADHALAGEDTTANTLAWMLDLLYRHPATLRRLQDEVRAAVPDPSGARRCARSRPGSVPRAA